MKISDCKAIMRACILARRPLLITGQPGVGKTEAAEQVCEELSHDLILEYLACADPTDGKGIPMPVNGIVDFVPIGTAKRLLAATRPTVCFMDDIGHATTAVQNAFMHWILARRAGNGERFPDCVTFMGATNRLTDRAGVHALHETVKSRFVTIINVEPDLEDFLGWAMAKPDFPMELIAFTKLFPDCITDFHPTSSMENTCSPRTLNHVAQLMHIGLPAHLEYESFSGAIGAGRAAQLRGFLQVFRTLPDIDEVLANPKGAVIPTEPTARMAICAALAARTTLKTVDAVVTYAERMPAEYSVLTVTMAIRRFGHTLIETPSVIRWATRHQEVML